MVLIKKRLTIAGTRDETFFLDETSLRASFRFFEPSGRISAIHGLVFDAFSAIVLLKLFQIVVVVAFVIVLAIDDGESGGGGFGGMFVRQNARRPLAQRMRHEDRTEADLALHQRHFLLQLPALILFVTAADDAARPLLVAGTTVGARRPLTPLADLTLRRK